VLEDPRPDDDPPRPDDEVLSYPDVDDPRPVDEPPRPEGVLVPVTPEPVCPAYVCGDC